MTSEPPKQRGGRSQGSDSARPDPPRLWLTHYPRMLAAYARRGEDGLEDVEEALRAKAAAQPQGKFSKGQAAYTPIVPLPPMGWRHKCGHCRFWVDHGPDRPGECMIVGHTDDYLGGKSIHEEAGCALFMPPAGESPFDWIEEQRSPSGADLVRGEYHPPPSRTGGETGESRSESGHRVQTERASGRRQPGGRDGRKRRKRERGRGRASRHTTRRDVGDTYIPAGTRIGLERVATGLSAPVELRVDPAEPSRTFIADQSGQVYVHTDEGLRDDPLLDVTDMMVTLQPQYDERGLLGMALHPDFGDTGRLFVRYSADRRSGTPQEYDHTEVLAEFVVDEARSQLDPASEATLLEVPSPQFNHNAGALAFGPDDGYLYVAMGDGGHEGDQGTGHVAGGNGQDVTENLLGGILRIDVDSGGDDTPYAIPDDNPLVGEDGLDEFYAWGLRNPWGLSFGSEGRLFVADVGQALYEEVNVVEAGGNYGWNVKEGYHCFDPDAMWDPPATCSDESDRGDPLLDPVIEYPHVHGDDVVGSAVVGGHLYEGTAVPDLDGAYVFGDWATTQDRPSGRLFAARPADGRWELEELVVADTRTGRPNRNVLAFGRDPDGELYLCANETHVPTGTTGEIYRIASRE